MSKPITEQAEKLADELDSGEFPEDLEPQYVAWLLRQLLQQVKFLKGDLR